MISTELNPRWEDKTTSESYSDTMASAITDSYTVGFGQSRRGVCALRRDVTQSLHLKTLARRQMETPFMGQC
jgi:hypothetical protein